MKQIKFSLTPELHAQLKAQAVKEGVSESRIVRRGLRLELGKHRVRPPASEGIAP